MITSYSTLLSELEAWDNRADLVAKYPGFIGLAEAHFNREILDPRGEVTVTQEISAASAALPSDFLQMKEIYLLTDPVVTLNALNASSLRDTYNWSGQPVAYALLAGDLLLGPSPDTAYEVSMTYVASLEGLTADNETNWLITRHPDLYLSATRFYSLKYLRDDEGAANELALTASIISSINKAGNRARLPATPICVQSTVRE